MLVYNNRKYILLAELINKTWINKILNYFKKGIRIAMFDSILHTKRFDLFVA